MLYCMEDDEKVIVKTIIAFDEEHPILKVLMREVEPNGYNVFTYFTSRHYLSGPNSGGTVITLCIDEDDPASQQAQNQAASSSAAEA